MTDNQRPQATTLLTSRQQAAGAEAGRGVPAVSTSQLPAALDTQKCTYWTVPCSCVLQIVTHQRLPGDMHACSIKTPAIALAHLRVGIMLCCMHATPHTCIAFVHISTDPLPCHHHPHCCATFSPPTLVARFISSCCVHATPHMHCIRAHLNATLALPQPPSLLCHLSPPHPP
jgi:hypothetical protein